MLITIKVNLKKEFNIEARQTWRYHETCHHSSLLTVSQSHAYICLSLSILCLYLSLAYLSLTVSLMLISASHGQFRAICFSLSVSSMRITDTRAILHISYHQRQTLYWLVLDEGWILLCWAKEVKVPFKNLWQY